ncbi:MAG: 4Fe-4S cluster-binding domain-containing protein [bacterium]
MFQRLLILLLLSFNLYSQTTGVSSISNETQHQLSTNSKRPSINYFDNPQYYRDLFLKNMKLIPTTSYTGKSKAGVFLTKFCPVGCAHCFFQSPKTNDNDPNDAFTDEGIVKLIKFLNDANMGYLMITGGGEPFLKYKAVLKMLDEVNSDKIIVVTSGFWATNRNVALKKIQEISDIAAKHPEKKIVIRLSVDEQHQESMGFDPILNIISVFSNELMGKTSVTLQLHSLDGDPTVCSIVEKLDVAKDEWGTGTQLNASNSNGIIKFCSKDRDIVLNNGLRIVVGYAKRFYSDWEVDLNDEEVVSRNVAVAEKDLYESENGFPSIAVNKDGSKGFNYSIFYDGLTTLWSAGSPDRKYNIYDHDYKTMISNSLADVITLSMVEKGYAYRDGIIGEVNPKAVIRAKAINLRDYVGSIINEEAKTRLYYTVRAAQDYIQENRITADQVALWPVELRDMVGLSKQELMGQYNTSSYDIAQQYKDENRKPEDLEKLPKLIQLGHYDVSDQNKSEADKLIGQLNDLMKAINTIKDQKDIIRLEDVVSSLEKYETSLGSEDIKVLYQAKKVLYLDWVEKQNSVAYNEKSLRVALIKYLNPSSSIEKTDDLVEKALVKIAKIANNVFAPNDVSIMCKIYDYLVWKLDKESGALWQDHILDTVALQAKIMNNLDTVADLSEEIGPLIESVNKLYKITGLICPTDGNLQTTEEKGYILKTVSEGKTKFELIKSSNKK